MNYVDKKKPEEKCKPKNLSTLGLCPSTTPTASKRLVSSDMPGVSFFIKAYMGKDPAFLFYSADFLIGTSFFTSAEVGDYIRILCHMHQVGGHMESQDLYQIAPNISDKVLKKFSITPDGLYFHTRLLTEIKRRQDFTASRLKNLKGSHVASHMGGHMETETETENKELLKGGVGGKPTLTECQDYFKELQQPLEADKFFDYFSSNGWKVGGRAAMKDWKSAARNWVRRAAPAGIGKIVRPKPEKTPEELQQIKDMDDFYKRQREAV